MFTNIAGIEWLNMGNEMGNINVSGMKGMMLRHRHVYLLSLYFSWCDLKHDFCILVFSFILWLVYDPEEENNTAVEAQEDSSQHANQGDDECGEDQINEEGEGKDFHERVEGLYSDNSPEGGNPPVAKQTSDGEG